jgi:hypothetical protein
LTDGDLRKRILIFDHNDMVRDSVGTLFEAEPGFGPPAPRSLPRTPASAEVRFFLRLGDDSSSHEGTERYQDTGKQFGSQNGREAKQNDGGRKK